MRGKIKAGNTPYGVFYQTVDRQLGMGNAVDEAGVCAVFQKTTHKIGQKIFVAADRCINPARFI